MEDVKIRFEPSGTEIRVQRGSTLYEAAQAAGLGVGYACDRSGICGRCALTLVEGADHLSPEEPLEAAVKRRNGLSPAARLSCVARVEGPVVATASYWGAH